MINQLYKKVFVIEDYIQHLNLYKAIFKKYRNTKLLYSQNGLEGLKLIQKEKPDLIILDYNLPDMNGVDICMTLRREKDFKDTPILIVSSSPVKGNKIEIFTNAGFTEILEKPIQISIFQRVIDKFLQII